MISNLSTCSPLYTNHWTLLPPKISLIRFSNRHWFCITTSSSCSVLTLSVSASQLRFAPWYWHYSVPTLTHDDLPLCLFDGTCHDWVPAIRRCSDLYTLTYSDHILLLLNYTYILCYWLYSGYTLVTLWYTLIILSSFPRLLPLPASQPEHHPSLDMDTTKWQPLFVYKVAAIIGDDLLWSFPLWWNMSQTGQSTCTSNQHLSVYRISDMDETHIQTAVSQYW